MNTLVLVLIALNAGVAAYESDSGSTVQLLWILIMLIAYGFSVISFRLGKLIKNTERK